MKKLFLALMALMASVTANAEAFDLWIAGTQVTTENQDDVLGDGSVIYYNNSNHGVNFPPSNQGSTAPQFASKAM